MEMIYDEILDLIHNRQWAKLKDILADMNEQDIAELFMELDERDLTLTYRLLPKDMAAEVFVNMEPEYQEMLIRAFSDTELSEVLDELYVDDAVDVIEEMPATLVRRILANTDPEMRKSINEILRYPEDSAGSIMTTEFVDLKSDMTVKDAFTRIRRQGVDKETIYTCYVTDNTRKLLGVITAKDLLLSDQNEIISDIMETNVISVSTIEDQEVVADMFSKYDLLALPVVDTEERLVGIVTVDDAIDVIQDEATEDMEKMAAITPTDKPYLKVSVFETWKTRFPWLLLLMVSATFTGKIIQSFESALAAQIVLTSYIPMLMDTGGNCGGQASVTIIRSLSLGDVEMKDILRVIWKEFRVAFCCGVTLAACNFVKLMFFDKITIPVAAVVCLTMILTIIIAKFVGSTLPILAKKIGFDPAVMASPFITTIVDAISLLVYFNVAGAILKI